MANDGRHFADEVITQEEVREEVEMAARRNRVWRQAFREIDSTGISSGVVEVPVEDGRTGDIPVVDEGDEYTREDEGYTKVSIEHDKYGREVEITMEAVQDGLLDVVALQAQNKAEDLADSLDAAAFAEVDGNVGDTVGPDTATGEMGYSDVVDAMTAIEEENYEPDMLIVPPSGKGDLLKSDEFTRASEMGDEVIRDGAFGQIAGLDVMVSNIGDLSDGEGYMFDSDHYGFESVRSDIETMEYDEEQTDSRVIKIRTRRGWKATREEAAVKIEA